MEGRPTPKINTMSKSILNMENISKSFSGVTVLENVELKLNEGRVHILAGENGAGKSTLIKILCGVYPEYEGDIILNRNKVKFYSVHDAARAGITVIHQELSLINELSVVDNLFLGREITGKTGWLNRAAQIKQAEKLLARLGLKIDVNKNVEDYPMNVKQMIEIAKALAIDARIIIFDEPTSALNEPDVVKLFEIIQNLKNQGCGIVYITHKMKEIYSIGDDITVLRDGKYIGTDTKENLDQDTLVKWMVGREMKQQFPERISSPGEIRLDVKNCSVDDPSGGPFKAVKNVSFQVRGGEIFGVAGLQGSGNSELFNGLFGSYGKNASAEMKIDDVEHKIGTPAQSIGRGFTLLTNDRKHTGLVLNMSIADNISLPSLKSFCKNSFIKRNEELNAANTCAERLRIKSNSVLQETQTLSGGNQQKVALGKWWQTNPKILLLDEPTKGVDVGAKHEIYELMNEWTKQGVSILLITSEMPELLAMSDRIIVMHLGEVTAEFSREEATQEKILHAAMGG